AEARGALARWSEAESGRLFLWCAPAFGFGALAYLAPATEPPVWIGAVLLAAGVAALYGWSGARAEAARPALVLATVLAAGFCVAAMRTASVAAPVISRETGPVSVTGRLMERFDEAGGGATYRLKTAAIEGIVSAETPAAVRLRWRGAAPEIPPAAGDAVRIVGVLNPPPGPVSPRGFHYARQAWFERLGATGYAVGPPEILEPETRPDFAERIERARTALAAHILATVDGPAGRLLAAMVTGKRGSVPEDAEEALRDAGLAHLLAISGLHIGIVAGLIFALSRSLLAAVPDLAVKAPVKKIAALAGIGATLAYLALSGGAWSARRAAIMALVAFLAILADRRAISLRNVAVAALIILAFSPEAVVHAGFHMSFAATTALVAAYEYVRSRPATPRLEGLRGRFAGYAAALAFTSVVAGLATGPFAVYHFNRSATFGLAGNLLAMPIVGLVTAPSAVAAAVAAPFGLSEPFLALCGKSLDAVLWVAHSVAETPGSVAHLATPPSWALLAVIGGGLWFCLQTAPWRVAGLAPILLGVTATGAPERPDIYVSRDGENAAVLLETVDGLRLGAWSVRRDRYALETWARRAGLDRDGIVPLAEFAECDDLGCVAEVQGRAVAISDGVDALFEDCARAELVVSLGFTPETMRRRCAARLIDRGDARDAGAIEISLSDPPEADAAPNGRPRPWDRGNAQ
ncbi:MAG: ComEC/Rec2 family competence protein, partial [Pseudomonadota bacterium]